MLFNEIHMRFDLQQIRTRFIIPHFIYLGTRRKHLIFDRVLEDGTGNFIFGGVEVVGLGHKVGLIVKF